VSSDAEARLGLRALLDSLEVMPADEWTWLAGRLLPRAYLPGQMLFECGGSDRAVHYLCSGLVRYFYLTEAGKERNQSFAAENNLVACLPSFIGGGPCTFTVEALEPTHTLVIPALAFARGAAERPYWQRLKLRLMEHVALRKSAREAEFLLDSAESRYRRFLTTHAELAVRIAQYHVASYLAITPVALSRIRRRMNPG
jgi:CRP-like cAMP-binding protein